MVDSALKIEVMGKIDFMGHWKTVRCVNPE